jgi:hypothetical protein
MRLHGEDDAYQERVQAEQRAAAEERERAMASILAMAKPVVAAAAPAPAVQLVPVANTGTAPRKTPAPEAVKWDDESVRAAVGPDFSAAVYFRDHPDVAADSWASANPERHWLAYGMAAGYAFPMPDAAPAAVQVKTVYSVPSLPAIPADLFPKPAPVSSTATQAQPIAQPQQQSMPMLAYPLTGGSAPIQTLAPGASLPASSSPTTARPAWVIPAAIAAAAGAAALLLIRRKPRAR